MVQRKATLHPKLFLIMLRQREELRVSKQKKKLWKLSLEACLIFIAIRFAKNLFIEKDKNQISGLPKHSMIA
jgi:hypothetical protein